MDEKLKIFEDGSGAYDSGLEFPKKIQHSKTCDKERGTTRPRQATCDEESGVKSRILTAIRMAISIDKETRVRADNYLKIHALDGLAEGAAIEIIQELGLDPEWTNLKDLRSTKEL